MTAVISIKGIDILCSVKTTFKNDLTALNDLHKQDTQNNIFNN